MRAVMAGADEPAPPLRRPNRFFIGDSLDYTFGVAYVATQTFVHIAEANGQDPDEMLAAYRTEAAGERAVSPPEVQPRHSSDMTSNTFDVLERQIPRDGGDNARYGARFELVSDFALQASSEYGPHIAGIESYGSWARRVGRAETDIGVDRVITTVTGELWTVQNKGYAADRRVDLNDFNNFNVASSTMPNVTRRILVTSGPGLGRNAADVSKRQGITDNVTVLNRAWMRSAAEYPATWTDLLASSATRPGPAKPYRLRPHQKDAIHDVARTLRSVPECQLLSACHTGKTITSVGI